MGAWEWGMGVGAWGAGMGVGAPGRRSDHREEGEGAVFLVDGTCGAWTIAYPAPLRGVSGAAAGVASKGDLASAAGRFFSEVSERGLFSEGGSFSEGDLLSADGGACSVDLRGGLFSFPDRAFSILPKKEERLLRAHTRRRATW